LYYVNTEKMLQLAADSAHIKTKSNVHLHFFAKLNNIKERE